MHCEPNDNVPHQFNCINVVFLRGILMTFYYSCFTVKYGELGVSLGRRLIDFSILYPYNLILDGKQVQSLVII